MREKCEEATAQTSYLLCKAHHVQWIIFYTEGQIRYVTEILG